MSNNIPANPTYGHMYTSRSSSEYVIPSKVLSYGI